MRIYFLGRNICDGILASKLMRASISSFLEKSFKHIIHTHTLTYGQDKRTYKQRNEEKIKKKKKKQIIIRKISHGTWDFEYFG